jgi:WD repeat-containing protein 45
VVDKRIEGKI